jgi:hypothetical protein
MMKLKKHKFKKRKKRNTGESSKTGLISQIHNSLNRRPRLNQEAQFYVKR